jgi:predicted aminopeptidase
MFDSPALATLRRYSTVLVLALALASLTGCSSLGYYWQSTSGHLALMQAARPVDVWLQDPEATDALKTRLLLGQQIRRFAAAELHLPDNASYQRYADLQRKAAVWNVVVAPGLSLKLQQWCLPVAGCVDYKGYFDEAAAEREGAQWRTQGRDVSVYPVPAYSTLGWMNWAGGDPLLNTFIHYPEGQLARLIFHELAHQVVYVSGDTAFNESFATAVERLGTARWLAEQASPSVQGQFARAEQRRQQFRALTLALQRTLRAIYAETGQDSEAIPLGIQADQRSQKAAAMAAFRQRYAELKTSWDGFAGYDAWVARTNNASLGALSAYDKLVPDFEALFDQEGRDWPRFYAAVKRIAALPKAERHAALRRDAP